jgi:DNA-binding XRE family transcriptional regulator
MNDAQASSAGQVTIYALTDPDTGEVRYIGQTIGDPVKRRYEHVVASHGPQCTPVGFWIRTLAEAGQVPGLIILEAHVAPHRNAEREVWWIAHYTGKGAHLLNKTTAAVSRWRPPPHPLRQWRDLHGLSQDELAERCGVGQEMISHIERYFRAPRTNTLLKLQEFTGLPADAFVRTERFLEEQPNFLRKYRRKGRGGRS